jgi:hypothetical protein
MSWGRAERKHPRNEVDGAFKIMVRSFLPRDLRNSTGARFEHAVSDVELVFVKAARSFSAFYEMGNRREVNFSTAFHRA